MIALRQLLVDVERRLQNAGIDSARTDAELLLAHILGITRSSIFIVDSLTEEQLHEYELVVTRRTLREPLQYIIGSAPFRRIELEVGPGVLVPRPETELMIEIIKRFGESGIALDLGAGSGCIGISLAVELPDLEVLAVENSEAALQYLERNVNKYRDNLNTGSSIDVIPTAIESVVNLRPDLIGKVQVIAANPPYVPFGSKVAPEVQLFEPATAVYAENDGYLIIDQVIEAAVKLLAEGGLLVIEHHEFQGATTSGEGVLGRIKKTQAFSQISAVDDLTNRPRFTYAVRKKLL